MNLIFSVLLIFAFPEPLAGRYVHDFANVLGEVEEAELERQLLLVAQETTAEVAVVTVTSLHTRNIDSYANMLFNKWGIGKRGVNNGILFLIAPGQRRTRIEVGYGLEPLFTDSLCGDILADKVIPEFKANRISSGIRAGALEIVRLLRRYPDAAQGVKGSAPIWVSTPRSDTKAFLLIASGVAVVFLLIGLLAGKTRDYHTVLYALGGVLVAGLTGYAIYLGLSLKGQRPSFGMFGSAGIALFTLVYNTRRFFRFGNRSCAQCGAPVELLDEIKDDQALEDVQKLEEKIGSVDYDVWVCPACLATDIKAYIKYFSGFSNCPKCTHRTYSEKSTTVVSASTYRSGLRRIDGNCVSCKHFTVRNQIIPRITESSSSSSSYGSSSGGGGYGGGSSGGGGASSSW